MKFQHLLILLLLVLHINSQGTLNVDIDSENRYATLESVLYDFKITPKDAALLIDLQDGTKNKFTIYLPQELSQGTGEVTCLSLNQATTTFYSLEGILPFLPLIDCITGTDSNGFYFQVVTNRTEIPDGQYEWIRLGPIKNPPSEGQGTDFKVCVTEFEGGPVCISKPITYLPNLLNVTISQTSYLVSAVSDLKLTVQLANDVPSDGSIVARLPSGYSTAKSFAVIEVAEDGVNRTISDCVSLDGLTVTITCADLGFGLSASDPPFNLYLFEVTNPSTIVAVPGVFVSTKLSNGLRVNENSPSASLMATIPSIIQFTGTPLTQQGSIINSEFSVSLAAGLPSLYPSGGTIWVYLPKHITIVNKVQCVFANGWNFFASGKCNAYFNYTSMSYYVVGTIAYPASNYVELTITNLKLPPEVRQLEPLYIVTHGADGNVMSVSSDTDPRMVISVNPGEITELALVRDVGDIINRDTSVTLTATFSDTYNRLARIRFELPTEQVTIPENVFGNGPYTCSIISQNDTFNVIECYKDLTSGWCATSTCSNSISINLIGLKNPSASYSYKHSVGAILYHFDYPDTEQIYLVHTTKTSFSFPPLLPDVINDYIFTSLDSKLAGHETTSTFSFTITTPLPKDCNVIFSFPDDFLYRSGPGILPQVETFSTYVLYYVPSGAIKRITVTNFLSTGKPSGTAFTWTLPTVRNAPHTVPAEYQGIIMTTETGDGGVLDQGKNNNPDIALQPNILPDVVTNVITPVVAGDIQSASIEFVTTNRVPKANGYFKVMLPAETAIEEKGGNPTSCQVQLGEVVGLCQIVDKNTILVDLSTISALVTPYVEKDTTVTISFNYLRNPQMAKKSSHLKIQSYLKVSETDYLIDVCEECATITPTQSNLLSAVSVTRNETTVNLPVKLTIQFTLYNPIPPTGSIIIQIPSETAVITSEGIDGIIVASLTAPDTPLTRSVGTESGTIKMEIPQFCDSTNGCPAKQQISFTIEGLQNPPNTVQSNSYFQISTKDRDEGVLYEIDIAENILATPQISAGQLTSVDIKRERSNTLASPISYTIDFTIANSIEGSEGQIIVLPYTETMMAKDPSNPSPKCSISEGTDPSNLVSVPCSATFNCISALNYCEFTSVTMSLKCPANDCSIGLKKRIVVDEVQSSFRTSGQGSFVIKTINTANNGVVDSANTSPESLTALQPMTLDVTNVQRSAPTIDEKVDLVVPFKIGLNYESESTSYIKVYATEFVLTKTIGCSVSLNGSDFSPKACSKIEQTDEYVKVMIPDPCNNPSGYCTKATSISVKLAGFSNAHSVKEKDPSKYLEVELYAMSTGLLLQKSNPNNFVIDPILSTAGVTEMGVTFSATKVGEITDIDLRLTPQVTLLVNDKVSLITDKPLFYKTDDTKCYKVVQGVESEVQCTLTNNAQQGYVEEIKFGDGLLPWTKDSALQIRIKDAKNLISTTPYTGILQSSIYDASGNLVATGTYSLANVPTLQPATLTTISLSRTSIQLDSTTDISLSFTLTAGLPPGSYAVLSLSLDQVVLAGDVSCTGTIQCSIISNTTEGAMVKINQICPSACTEGTRLEATIKGFKNPSYSYADATKNKVVTYTGTGEVVHSAADISASPSLDIPQIEISSMVNSNPYTSQITTYAFSVKLPKKVPAGGLLILTIPTNIMLKGQGIDPECSASGTKYECVFEYSGQSLVKVVYKNLCAAECAESAIYQLLIENLKNPPSTAPLSGFLSAMSTYQPDSRLVVSEGSFDLYAVSISPTPLLSTSAVRSNPSLGAITTLTISFTTRNPVPSSGKFQFVVPKVQGEFQETTKCYDNKGVQLQCTLSQGEGDDPKWTVKLNQFCDHLTGCSSDQTVVLVLTDIKNPILLLGNNYGSSLGITTYTSTLAAIDAVTSGFFVTPLLEAKRLGSVFAGIVSAEAGTETTIFMQFIPYADLQQDYRLVLDLAKIKLPGTTCGEEMYTRIYPTYNASRKCTKDEKTIVLENICSPEGCPKDKIVTVELPYKNAPYAHQVAGTLGLYVRTLENSDYAYGSTTLDIKIKPHSITDVEMSDSSCTTTGALCPSFGFSFTLFNSIPAEIGNIKIIVPSELDISQSSCTVSIPNLKQLESCVISANKEIIVTDSATISAESTISIILSKIWLPATTKPTQVFRIESTRVVSNVVTLVDADYSFKFAVPNPRPFSPGSIQVTRVNTSIGSPSDYFIKADVDFSLPNTGSYVIIEIPKGASVEVIPGAKCTVSVDSVQRPCKITSNSTMDLLKIDCGSTQCGNENQINFVVPETVLKNKGYVSKSPSSIKIHSSFDGIYLSQTSTEYISITPKLKTLPFEAVLSRDSNIFSHSITLSLTIKVNNTSLLPARSAVLVKLPNKLFLKDAVALTCSVSGRTVGCIGEGTEYLQTLKINNLCPTSCSEGNLVVRIEGLKNPYKNHPESQEETKITTVTAGNEEIGKAKSGKFSLLQPIELQEVKVEEAVVSNTSSVLFLLYSPNKIESGSVLDVVLENTTYLQADIAIEPFMSVQTNPKVARNSSNLTITDLFLNDTDGADGIIYGFYLKKAFQLQLKPYTVTANIFVSSSKDSVLSYKRNVSFTIGSAGNKSCSNASETPNLELGVCVDNCSAGYFHYNRNCIRCFDPNCIQCENKLQRSCSACKPPYFLKDGVCVSYCGGLDTVAIGNVNTSTNISRCARNRGCSAMCGKAENACSYNPDYCFNCDSSLLLMLGFGQCTEACPKGYFESEHYGARTCLKCHYSCAECNATTCKKCSNLYERYLVTNRTQCITQCPERTYTNTTTHVCEMCNGTCRGCFGPMFNNCISCDSPFFLYNSECVRECPEGFVGDEAIRECVAEVDTLEAKDLWLATTILLGIALTAVGVCKVLSIFKIVRTPYSVLETLCSLITAVDTLNRIFLLADLWAFKNTTLFTFACGNLIINSMTMMLFHANFFSTFLQAEGSSKSGSVFVVVTTILSFIFGFNFIRLLSSGFFLDGFSQPYKKSLEYNREISSMGTYVMYTNIAQIVIYGCCYLVGTVGISSIGICLNVSLVALHGWELFTDYAKYQFIINSKLP